MKELKNKYVVFDLEATCHRNGDPKGFSKEIIEIGAVKINEDGKIIDEFSEFCKPLNSPVLSDFCKELTTINQEDIDNSEPIKDVLTNFLKWSKDSILLSWGNFDKNQIILDMKSNKIKGFNFDHLNLKYLFTRWKGLRRGKGVKRSLRIEEMEFDGTPHRGIDDAKNIAKIFVKNIDLFKLTYKYVTLYKSESLSPINFDRLSNSLFSEENNDDDKLKVFKIIFGKYNDKKAPKEIKRVLLNSLNSYKDNNIIRGFYKALKHNS